MRDINMEFFLQELIDMLDTEAEIRMESYLSDIEEWDSLSVISFVAMADIKYSKKLLAVDIRKAQTVQDLYDFVVAE